MSREREDADAEGALVEEQLLSDLLRAQRPDAAEFLRGVQERIAQGEPRAPRWLQSAAALLPAGLVRGEALGLGGGLGAKPASWAAKVALAPAAGMLGLVLLFAGSLRAVRGLGTAELVLADSPRAAETRRRNRWVHPMLLVQLAVLVFVLLAARPELALWILALSMALLAGLFARLEREGLAARTVIGATCAELLTLLAVYAAIVSPLPPAVPAALSAGALLCSLAPDRRPRRTTLSRYNAVVAGLLALWFVPAAIAGPAGRGALARFAEGFDGGTSTHWRRWSLVASALARDGVALELGHVAERLHARLDAGEEVDPYTLAWAARLELLRPEDERALADENARALERLLAAQGPIPFIGQAALELWALERARGLEPSERARAVERLVASLPLEPEHQGIANALAVVELLEGWGELAAVRAVAPAARAQLAASWQSDGSAAAFAPGPALARQPLRPEAAFVVIDDTLAGLELMVRCGVPEGLDLAQLERFLEGAASSALRGLWLRADHERAAAAGLLTLEGLTGYRRLSARPAWALRPVWPAALLALFCLFATLRARPAPR